MKTLAASIVLLVALAAVPVASAQTGFCDLFQPPPQGPVCVVADEALDTVRDNVEHAENLYGIVYDIAWGATEGVRCIIIKALGGSC